MTTTCPSRLSPKVICKPYYSNLPRYAYFLDPITEMELPHCPNLRAMFMNIPNTIVVVVIAVSERVQFYVLLRMHKPGQLLLCALFLYV